MHGEADVLQHRIEVAALDRRLCDARERIGSDENEKIERAGFIECEYSNTLATEKSEVT